MRKKWLQLKQNINRILLYRKRRKQDKRHVDILLSIAQADGHVDQKEAQLLREMSRLYGHRAKASSKKNHDINLIQPKYFREVSARADAFYEIVLMMTSDGKETEEEYNCCRKYAEVMEYDRQDTELLVFAFNGGLLGKES